MKFAKLACVLFLLPSIVMAVEIKVCASESAYEALFAKKVKAFEEATKNKVSFVGDMKKNSSDSCIQSVIDGKSDLGTAVGTWNELEPIAMKNGAAKDALKGIANRVIGRDLLKAITHSGIKVGTLSFEQVESILSGKVTNWKELGANDIPITYVAGFKVGAAFLQKAVLRGKEITAAKVIDAESVLNAITIVAKTPGAIAFLSSGRSTPEKDVNSVEIISKPPLGRTFLGLTKGRPSHDVDMLMTSINQFK